MSIITSTKMAAMEMLMLKCRNAALSYCRFFSVYSFPKVFLKEVIQNYIEPLDKDCN
jgi:hypothetical protein